MTITVGSAGITFRLIQHHCSVLLVVLGLLLVYIPASAQKYFKFDKPIRRLTMNFSQHRNLMIIPLYINEKGPFNFVLDTGVGMGLITNPRLLDSLNLTKGPSVNIAGAGSENEDLKAFLVQNINMRIPGISAHNLTFTILSEDIFNLSTYVGVPISGIIGYQFFNSFVVKIDFIESKLVLFNPETFKYRKFQGEIIPFQLEMQRPYLFSYTTLQDGTRLQTKLILDTGAGHAISLEQSSHPQIRIPEPALRTQLGTGLNGLIRGYIGRAKSFELGSYTFNNVLTSFPDYNDIGAKAFTIPRNGNLGMEILKRFNLYIDYSRSRVMVKGNRLLREPFEHDMCGLEILALGKTLDSIKISRIEPGSPAQDADLQVGDEIVFINSLSIDNLTVSRIDRLLHSRDGNRLIFIIRRNGDLLYRIVTLRKRV